MARLAVALTLIFSLFLLSQARLQPNQQENGLVEWNPLTSNDDLPDSATQPTILLPSERFKEDAISSGEVAESLSNDVAVASPNMVSETSISSTDDEVNHYQHHHHHHHHHHKKHKKHSHHHHHKNHTECHHHHPKNHTDCHHHHKNHSRWEKEDKEIAGKEIPSGDDLNKAEKTELFHGDSTEGMMRSEEGKMKHHHHKKEGKKGKEGKIKKHRKKEGKKEKKHGGLRKFFHKLFKHFH